MMKSKQIGRGRRLGAVAARHGVQRRRCGHLAKRGRGIGRRRRAGKSRILVGPDAYVFDFLGRAMPMRYFDVLALLERLPARRS
jgi:hypothetical protein